MQEYARINPAGEIVGFKNFDTLPPGKADLAKGKDYWVSVTRREKPATTQWQKATSAWSVSDDGAVLEWTVSANLEPDHIKAACSSEIRSRIGDTSQRNIIALVTRKAFELADEMMTALADVSVNGAAADLGDAQAALAALKGVALTASEIQDWIAAMQVECRAAISEAREPSWPDWNSDWNALVELV